MKKLTIKTPEGPALNMNDTYPNEEAAREDLMQKFRDAVNRLSDYEDIGLMPEEIKALILVPNSPLTLEQLRGMEGKPVWVVDVASINKFRGHWDICDWENGEAVSFPYCMESPDIGQYGITWLAYRRRPEEDTNA